MSEERSGARTCDKCGVSISDEDFRNQTAARYKGKTLCPKCTGEVRTRILAAKKAESATQAGTDISEVPLALPADVLTAPDEGTSQIHGFSGAATLKQEEKEYKRPLLTGTRSATRCKTFHCKLTGASFQNLNDQINEWVDEHESVEIKYALSDIGVVEGKHSDPHLIVTIFY